MTHEEWRAIGGHPGYEVSSLGRVYSHRRFQGTSGRELKGWVNRDGYRKVGLQPGDTQHFVHYLVAEAFHGPRPEGMEIRHLDGQKTNNAASNLKYGTRSENLLDRVVHGEHPQARRTHCPQGHPYDEANTYITPSTGDRICRTCSAAHKRAYRERQTSRAAGLVA